MVEESYRPPRSGVLSPRVITWVYSCSNPPAATHSGRSYWRPHSARPAPSSPTSAARMCRSRSSSRNARNPRVCGGTLAGQVRSVPSPASWPASSSARIWSCSGPLTRVGGGSPRAAARNRRIANARAAGVRTSTEEVVRCSRWASWSRTTAARLRVGTRSTPSPVAVLNQRDSVATAVLVFPLPAAPCTTGWPPARIAACIASAAAAARARRMARVQPPPTTARYFPSTSRHRPPTSRSGTSTSPWPAAPSFLLRVGPAVGLASVEGDGLLLHHRCRFPLPRARPVIVPEQVPDLVVDHVLPVERVAPAGVQELLGGLGVPQRIDHRPALVRARVAPQGAHRGAQVVHLLRRDQDQAELCLGVGAGEAERTIGGPAARIVEGLQRELREGLAVDGQPRFDLHTHAHGAVGVRIGGILPAGDDVQI